jgi:Tfp pilus assembly protein PilX
MQLRVNGRRAKVIERTTSMFQKALFIKNEEGSAIVVAVMILMVVTIIGVSSTNTTTVELQIVRNDGIYKQNLYLAEAAAQEGIQRIWNLSRTDPFRLERQAPAWLNNIDDFDLTNPGTWDNDGAGGDDNAEVSSTDADAILAVTDRIAEGGSLDISSETNAHQFAVFGIGNRNNGRVFIEIGYRERF